MTAGEENLGLTACLAEYEALRNEIAWLIDHALHIQNYAIGITAGLYPAAALVYRAAPLLVVPLLLTVPLPLSVLGFLYFRQHQEVYVVAAYIREYLRPLVRKITGQDELWGWEEFKSSKSRELATLFGRLGLQNQRVVLLFRLALFIVPAVSAVGVAIGLAVAQGRQELVAFFGTSGLIALLAACVLDAGLIGLLLRRFWAEGDFEKGILGLKKPSLNVNRPSPPASEREPASGADL